MGEVPDPSLVLLWQRAAEIAFCVAPKTRDSRDDVAVPLQALAASMKRRLNRRFAHLDREAQGFGFQLIPKAQGEDKQNPMPSIAKASVTQESTLG